ncbi:Protein N-terminal glutamine amidohydrolase [Halotydeus destructor]|nr:Protein N-terminal glutamine amidohydrolase [Halotydeus destructor]
MNYQPLVEREHCVYTSCYCEENVWKLCEYIKNKDRELLPSCYAVFISNDAKQVPIWMQRSGQLSDDHLCVWDYHVIMVHKFGECSFAYDFDTVLNYPSRFDTYFHHALKSDDILIDEKYYRKYRVVNAEQFISTFSSDRSHMRRADGSWTKEPPGYECIRNGDCLHNLDSFTTMSQESFPVGQVMDSNDFYDFFKENKI